MNKDLLGKSLRVMAFVIASGLYLILGFGLAKNKTPMSSGILTVDLARQMSSSPLLPAK